MLRTPPHILVTTPESLYLLLTAERSREMLKTARVVIVDEIHARAAVAPRRAPRAVARAPGPRLRPQAAAHRPVRDPEADRRGGEVSSRLRPCQIVDKGHKRQLDLAVEVPGSPLEAVMSHEVWQEIYDRLVELIGSHRTTLITVNTRRLAERMAHQLSERLGAEHVAAHHGSLASEARLDAEERLKGGRLKVLVATASLELGIDIGHVDLVCQISSPHRIATFLQRVGRSGHTIKGVPKGRIFPLTRDDLIECAAMVAGRARGRARPRRGPGPAARRPRAADRRGGVGGGGMGRGRAARSFPAELPVPQSREGDVPRSRGDARARLRHAARPARRADPLRQPQPQAPQPQGLAHERDHQRRGDSRGVRLPRAGRARGSLHRHAERGLRHRIAAGRRVPARQHLLAHPAYRQRRGARRRRRRASRRRCRSGSARRRRAARR